MGSLPVSSIILFTVALIACVYLVYLIFWGNNDDSRIVLFPTENQSLDEIIGYRLKGGTYYGIDFTFPDSSEELDQMVEESHKELLKSYPL